MVNAALDAGRRRSSIGVGVFRGESSVPTAVARAQRYSDLAEECHELARLQTDPALRAHYESIAGHYLTLAEAELRLAEREAAAQSQRSSIN
jgi:hypothetical protein